MKDATRSPAQTAPITVAGTGQPEPNEQFAKFQLKPEDIGGELLPILSKGLYTDPLHAVREYVQNSVDADAQKSCSARDIQRIHECECHDYRTEKPPFLIAG